MARNSVLVAVLLACLARPLPAAQRFWVGGTGNWSDVSHWAATSGGDGGASVPTAADDVRFDAASGAATVTLDQNANAASVTVESGADATLTLSFNGRTLTCAGDCQLLNGRVNQGTGRTSRLIVGGNLSTAECGLIYAGEYNLSIHLTGTSTWRYSLDAGKTPHLWNLLAAQPGCTTTLRPVGYVPPGVDIDAQNQVILGDQTSRLAVDITEATNANPPVTIEIHNQTDKLDMVASGCRLDIVNLEHEMVGSGPGLLQSNVAFTRLNTYDVTGAYNAPAGSGPTWVMTGPMDMGNANLSIEKTSVFSTGGYDLQVGTVTAGTSSNGTGELHVESATVTAAGRVSLGGSTMFGYVRLGTGLLTCSELRLNNGPGLISGQTGGTLDIAGSAGASGTVYYVSSSGDDDLNDGLSQAAPFRTFLRGMSQLAPSVTILFRRGDTITVPNGCTVGATGGRVGAYGTGPKPVLLIRETGGVLNLTGATWSMFDLVLVVGEGTVAAGDLPYHCVPQRAPDEACAGIAVVDLAGRVRIALDHGAAPCVTRSRDSHGWRIAAWPTDR